MSGWVIDYLGGTYSATFVNLVVTGNFTFGDASVDLLLANGNIQLKNDVNLVFGTTDASTTAVLMQYDTAETNDGFKMGVDETSRHFIITDYGDINTDTTLANANNPTLYIFAASFATTKYISFAHNGSNGLVTLGVGDTVFSSGLIAGSNGYGINTNLGTQQGISAGGNITIISGASGSGVSIATSSNASSGTSAFFTATSGSNTNQTAGSEELIANWDLSATLQFATGSLATQRAFVIKAPTYGFVASSTVTTNVVFQIDKASAAGTNAIFTNTYLAQFGGSVNIGASAASQKYGILDIPAHTVTVTGSTGNTLTAPGFFGISIGIITITDASAVTIANAAGLTVAPPVGAGSVTLSSTYAIYSTGDVLLTSDKNLTFGTTNAAGTSVLMQYDTAETNDGFKLGVDETSRHFIICDYGDINTDTTAAVSTDPTLYIFAASFATTKHVNLRHDGSNGIMATGTGGIDFRPASNVTTLSTSTGAAMFNVNAGLGATPSVYINPAAYSAGVSPTLWLIRTSTNTGNAGYTASTEAVFQDIDFSQTHKWAAGALATQRFNIFRMPTISFASASTATTVVGFTIDQAPQAGSNATFTNTYLACWGGNATLGAASASMGYSILEVPSHTLTITGSTNITATNPPTMAGIRIGAITITDASAITITQVAALVVNSPVSAGSVTITKKLGIWTNGRTYDALGEYELGNNTFAFKNNNGTDFLTLNSGNGASVSTFAITGAATTGTPKTFVITPGAHTGLTGESLNLSLVAAAFALADGTTIALQRSVSFGAMTYNGVAGGGTETITTLVNAEFAAPVVGSNITVTNPVISARFLGNVIIGNGAAITGATAAGVLALSNNATAPTNAANLAQLYGTDLGAVDGQACLAIYQEYAPYAGAAIVSTTKIPVVVNGTAYYLLATTVA